AALVMMSSKFNAISKGVDSPLPAADDFRFYETIQQSDLAPTLAGLLKIPTPKKKQSVFISSLLPLLNENEQELVLCRNERHIMRILQASYPDFEARASDALCSSQVDDDVDKLACVWHQLSQMHKNKSNPQSTIAALSKFSGDCQKILASMA